MTEDKVVDDPSFDFPPTSYCSQSLSLPSGLSLVHSKYVPALESLHSLLLPPKPLILFTQVTTWICFLSLVRFLLPVSEKLYQATDSQCQVLPSLPNSCSWTPCSTWFFFIALITFHIMCVYLHILQDIDSRRTKSFSFVFLFPFSFRSLHILRTKHGAWCIIIFHKYFQNHWPGWSLKVCARSPNLHPTTVCVPVSVLNCLEHSRH